MKLAITAIIALFTVSSVYAQAPRRPDLSIVNPVSGTVKVIDVSITKAQLNDLGKLQVEFAADYNFVSGNSGRIEHAVTCGQYGGHFADKLPDGEIDNESQRMWLVNGDTILDRVAAYVCIRGLEKAKNMKIMRP